jgi:hypothetical protein
MTVRKPLAEWTDEELDAAAVVFRERLREPGLAAALHDGVLAFARDVHEERGVRLGLLAEVAAGLRDLDDMDGG